MTLTLLALIGCRYVVPEDCRIDGVVTGVVQRQSGEPLPGAFITATDDELHYRDETDVDGRYRLEVDSRGWIIDARWTDPRWTEGPPYQQCTRDDLLLDCVEDELLVTLTDCRPIF